MKFDRFKSFLGKKQEFCQISISPCCRSWQLLSCFNYSMVQSMLKKHVAKFVKKAYTIVSEKQFCVRSYCWMAKKYIFQKCSTLSNWYLYFQKKDARHFTNRPLNLYGEGRRFFSQFCLCGEELWHYRIFNKIYSLLLPVLSSYWRKHSEISHYRIFNKIYQLHFPGLSSYWRKHSQHPGHIIENKGSICTKIYIYIC